VIAVYLHSQTQQHSNSRIGGSHHECDWALFGHAFWKDDEQTGSYRFVCRISTENALVLIEKFSTSILGTLRGRYRMPSGIILYQTTSADTV
jgi:hypothetical protein